MPFFDSIADSKFIKDKLGNTVFYPWGNFGSGFFVETNEIHAKYKNHIKKILMIGLLVVGASVLLIHNNTALILTVVIIHCPLLFSWEFLVVRKLTKDLKKSPQNLKYREFMGSYIASQSVPKLVTFFAGSIALLAMSIWNLQDSNNNFPHIVSVVFFGLVSVLMGYQILLKIRNG